MRFLPTEEQRAFAGTVGAVLRASAAGGGAPAAARAWAAGDVGPGRELFRRLAAAGVFALAVPERQGGAGEHRVELVLACVELGRAAAPGPLVETVAAGALLAGVAEGADTRGGGTGGPGGTTVDRAAVDRAAVDRLLAGVLAGAPTTLAPPGGSGHALDADTADAVLVLEGPGCGVVRLAGGHGPSRVSVDPVRRAAVPRGGGAVLASGPRVALAAARAGELARLLTAAQSLGVGLALLERTVAHVRARHQFGRPIASFQAVRHRLADTLIAIEFARPLVHGAAVTGARADIAAAKTAAGEAGYAAARTALQLHGAIGYTDELELSLWLRKARPLRDAWGTPSACRAAVLAALPGETPPEGAPPGDPGRPAGPAPG
ncbi:acyl-CoA dehydrogenase family protein [Streptomyces sp. NPDC000594]|uniref:acyl-CoA dehydrogenase family protein n=1 Tax=Streptomyces sp. NPDC000594 TaxID=3154261 RepID=UPI00331F0785